MNGPQQAISTTDNPFQVLLRLHEYDCRDMLWDKLL